MQRAKRLIALDHALAEAKANVREVGGWNAGPTVEMYQRADSLPGERYAWCQSFMNAMWRMATGGRIVGGNLVGGEMLANGTASVGFAVAWARERGYIVARPYRGDHFAMLLNADSWADHTGQVDRVLSLGGFGFLCRTVEGNTGSGSIDEGDGVYVRTRFLRADRTIFYRVPGSVAVFVRTPARVLQRKVGYWSWLQWRLGEGAWKGWEPRDPLVRPDVLARISLTWFKALAAFLARRKS